MTSLQVFICTLENYISTIFNIDILRGDRTWEKLVNDLIAETLSRKSKSCEMNKSSTCNVLRLTYFTIIVSFYLLFLFSSQFLRICSLSEH
jgi:hypothetical protein